MKITENFRDQILFAMPELAQADADKIAALEGCTPQTIYNHWKKLKDLDGDLTGIMLSLGELAASKKKVIEKDHKRADKIMKQLSAA